jgi:hypothetical protein
MGIDEDRSLVVGHFVVDGWPLFVW